MRRTVDLPQPDGQIRTKKALLSILREKSATASAGEGMRARWSYRWVPASTARVIRSQSKLRFAKVQQIADGHKFRYLLSERHQFAAANRFASFA